MPAARAGPGRRRAERGRGAAGTPRQACMAGPTAVPMPRALGRDGWPRRARLGRRGQWSIAARVQSHRTRRVAEHCQPGCPGRANLLVEATGLVARRGQSVGCTSCRARRARHRGTVGGMEARGQGPWQRRAAQAATVQRPMVRRLVCGERAEGRTGEGQTGIEKDGRGETGGGMRGGGGMREGREGRERETSLRMARMTCSRKCTSSVAGGAAASRAVAGCSVMRADRILSWLSGCRQHEAPRRRGPARAGGTARARRGDGGRPAAGGSPCGRPARTHHRRAKALAACWR